MIVLTVYNPPESFNGSEQLLKEYNEGTTRTMQLAARRALLTDGGVVILRDFNCTEIDW